MRSPELRDRRERFATHAITPRQAAPLSLSGFVAWTPRYRSGDAWQAQRDRALRESVLPPTADTHGIGAEKLLPTAAREANGLQSLHRLGWLLWKGVKRVRGESKLGDRNATALGREPAKPPHRGTLIAIGITVSQYQADAQRVVKGDLWELTGRGEYEVGVAGLERAPEASVWTAGVGHCERMFASSSSWTLRARGCRLVPASGVSGRPYRP